MTGNLPWTYWPSEEGDCKTDECKLEWIRKSMQPFHNINYSSSVALKFEKELLEKGVLKHPMIPVQTDEEKKKEYLFLYRACNEPERLLFGLDGNVAKQYEKELEKPPKRCSFM